MRALVVSDIHGNAAPPEVATADGGSAAPLDRIAAIAQRLDEEHVRDEARRLADRAAEGRFYVACIGQFKRGKSTLLDALLGRAVLPADVVPVTAVPTVVRYGPAWRARVRTAGAAWQEIALDALPAYVSEAGNPENAKGVQAVEVFAPAALLRTGMCLVDTPGLGSVFAGNTEATHAFVPHIDAAIVVVGADPPISGDELDLVQTVSAQVPHLLVVLNKADRSAPSDRTAAAAFTQTVLYRRLGRTIDPVYEVSALERLEGRGPARDWAALVEALTRLAADSGASIAADSARRGAHRLTRRLVDVVDQRRLALTRPLEESTRRTAALADAARQAEVWLDDLDGVLAGEQRRLLADLDARRTAWMETARRDGDAVLAARIRALRQRWGPELRRRAMAEALSIARDLVAPWLIEQQDVAAAAFAQRASRFRELEREFVQRVAGMGVPEFAGVKVVADEDAGLAGRAAFHFEPLLDRARPASPVRHAVDVVLAAAGARGAILDDARRFLAWLLEVNSSRVAADVGERLAESRRRLERDVRTLLRDLNASATRAVEHATEVRRRGAEQVRAELAALDGMESDLRELAGSEGGEPAAEPGR